jgi:hypothetical protein
MSNLMSGILASLMGGVGWLLANRRRKLAGPAGHSLSTSR